MMKRNFKMPVWLLLAFLTLVPSLRSSAQVVLTRPEWVNTVTAGAPALATTPINFRVVVGDATTKVQLQISLDNGVTWPKTVPMQPSTDQAGVTAPAVRWDIAPANYQFFLAVNQVRFRFQVSTDGGSTYQDQDLQISVAPGDSAQADTLTESVFGSGIYSNIRAYDKQVINRIDPTKPYNLYKLTGAVYVLVAQNTYQNDVDWTNGVFSNLLGGQTYRADYFYTDVRGPIVDPIAQTLFNANWVTVPPGLNVDANTNVNFRVNVQDPQPASVRIYITRNNGGSWTRITMQNTGDQTGVPGGSTRWDLPPASWQNFAVGSRIRYKFDMLPIGAAVYLPASIRVGGMGALASAVTLTDNGLSVFQDFNQNNGLASDQWDINYPVDVWKNGVLQTKTVDYTVDYANGKISGLVNPLQVKADYFFLTAIGPTVRGDEGVLNHPNWTYLPANQNISSGTQFNFRVYILGRQPNPLYLMVSRNDGASYDQMVPMRQAPAAQQGSAFGTLWETDPRYWVRFASGSVVRFKFLWSNGADVPYPISILINDNANYFDQNGAHNLTSIGNNLWVDNTNGGIDHWDPSRTPRWWPNPNPPTTQPFISNPGLGQVNITATGIQASYYILDAHGPGKAGMPNINPGNNSTLTGMLPEVAEPENMQGTVLAGPDPRNPWSNNLYNASPDHTFTFKVFYKNSDGQPGHYRNTPDYSQGSTPLGAGTAPWPYLRVILEKNPSSTESATAPVSSFEMRPLHEWDNPNNKDPFTSEDYKAGVEYVSQPITLKSEGTYHYHFQVSNGVVDNSLSLDAGNAYDLYYDWAGLDKNYPGVGPANSFRLVVSSELAQDFLSPQWVPLNGIQIGADGLPLDTTQWDFQVIYRNTWINRAPKSLRLYMSNNSFLYTEPATLNNVRDVTVWPGAANNVYPLWKGDVRFGDAYVNSNAYPLGLGGSWRQGYNVILDLVKKDPADNNYSQGVLYHLANSTLIYGTGWRYKLVADDGSVVTTMMRTGTGQNAILAKTAQTLAKINGYFFDPGLNPTPLTAPDNTKGGAYRLRHQFGINSNTPPLYLWEGAGDTATAVNPNQFVINDETGTFTPKNPAFTPRDGLLRGSFYHIEEVGPSLSFHQGPMLTGVAGNPSNLSNNYLTMTPLYGNSTSEYTFKITYSNFNGRPGNVFLVMDQNSATTQTLQMAVDPAHSLPIDFTQPVVFMVKIKLTPGVHTYHFVCNDGSGNSYYNADRFPFNFLPDGTVNPVLELTSPSIPSGEPIELSGAHYQATDTRFTATTKFDYFITYTNTNGLSPANGWPKVYFSNNGGGNWDGGHAMVQAPSSGTNYSTGVTYHLDNPVTWVPGTAYRYKFVASDGTSTQTKIRVGTGQTALNDKSAHTLVGFAGETGILFSEPSTDSRNVPPIPITTARWHQDTTQPDYVNNMYVWRNGQLINYMDPVNKIKSEFTVDQANGYLTLNPAGTVNDVVNISYYFTECLGPNVELVAGPTLASAAVAPTNTDATLNYGTISNMTGTTATSFTYSIKYFSTENRKPATNNIVIDNAQPVAMTLDQATPTPIDYTAGVVYKYTTTLANGQHRYHFDFTDDLTRSARYPLTTATTPELPGPTVSDSTVKTLELSSASFLSTDGLSTPNSPYDFFVSYRNTNGTDPVLLKIYFSSNDGVSYDNGTDMVLVNGSGTSMNGARYHLATPVKFASIGNHYRFKFQASDGVTLVNQVHVGSGSTAYTSSTARQLTATDQTFTTYFDPALTYKLLADQNQTYVWVGGAPVTFNFGPQDGQITLTSANAANAAVMASYFYTEIAGPNIIATQGPSLAALTTDAPSNFGTVTPMNGSPAQMFTFTVIYSSPDNRAPASISVVVDNQTHALTMDPSTGSPFNYIGGVKYSTQLNLASGLHTYHFITNDGQNGLARYPLATSSPVELTGPNVSNNVALPLELVNPIFSPVAPTGTLATQYDVFVTYKHSGNLQPNGGIVQLQISSDEGVTWGAPINLNPIANAGITNFVTGVQYHMDSPRTLPLGPARFRFSASDGTVTANNIHVGNGVNSLSLQTAHVLTPAGINNIYFDQVGRTIAGNGVVGTKGWLNDPAMLMIWRNNTLLNYSTDYTVDIAKGQVALTLPALPTDVINASYYYRDTLGPVILATSAPVLAGITNTASDNYQTVAPMTGLPLSGFKFYIMYSSQANRAPKSVNLVVDNTAAQAMTMDPALPLPVDYTKGVRYSVTVNTLQLGVHAYHFTTDDGVQQSTFPLSSAKSTELAGPNVSNEGAPVAELTNPSFTASDMTGTTATKYDFYVTFKDANNNAPNAVMFYISDNNGSTYANPLTMVKIDASVNYVSGVGYHLSAPIQLTASNQHRYKFVATTSLGTQVTQVHVGTGLNALSNGTAHGMVADISGALSDPIGTRTWMVDSNTVFLWRNTTIVPLIFNTDYTVDGVNGKITLKAPAAPADAFTASYFYTETLGPVVKLNQAPTLAAPGGDILKTLTPQSGEDTTSYQYSIIYTDLDNQAPSYVNLYVDGGNTVLAMTQDPAATKPLDYTKGIKYTVKTTLTPGSHSYHFVASDGADICSFPAAGVQPSELVGPDVNNAGILTNPTILPYPKGMSTQLYSFTVTYKNANGLAPIMPLTLFISTITSPPVTTKVDLAPIDPVGAANFPKGVRYQAQVRGSAIGSALQPGSYDIQFGFGGAPSSSTGVRRLTVNAAPTLSDPPVVTPASSSQTGTFVFGVTYTDKNGDAPVRNGSNIKLLIDGTARSEGFTTLPVNPTTADYQAGVTYQFSVAGRDLSLGDHKFQISAGDDLEDAITVPAAPGGSFTVTAANTPELSYVSPGDVPTNNGSIDRLTGSLSTVFNYRVNYKHLDGVAPINGVSLVIDAGTANQVTKSMTIVNPASGTIDYKENVTYGYTSQAGELTAGAHTYSFKAADSLTTVSLPTTGSLTGPTIKNNPALALGTLYQSGTTTFPVVGANNILNPPIRSGAVNKFIFRVVYTHPDNIAPVEIKVRLNNSVDVVLQPRDTAPFDYRTGVTFESAEQTFTVGQQTFHFTATDTSDTVLFPAAGEISGVTIINSAQFSNIALNPVKPMVGSSTTLTGVISMSTMTSPKFNMQIVKPDGSGSSVQVQTLADNSFSYAFVPDQTGDWVLHLSWDGVAGSYDPINIDKQFTVGGFQLQLTSGQLQLISIPLIPIQPTPVTAFNPKDASGVSVDVSFLNAITWVLGSGGTGSYIALNSTPFFPAITNGQGYWIRPNMQMSINPIGRLYDQTTPFSINLKEGWNLIGTAYLTDTSWSGTQVRSNGVLQNVLLPAQTIIRPVAWGYDPVSGSYLLVDGKTPATDSLKSGSGYWVRAMADCELVFPAPARSVPGKTRALAPREPSIQISARSGDRADVDNYVPLTGLNESRMVQLEKPPYMANYVSIHFLPSGSVTLPDNLKSMNGKGLTVFEVLTDKKNADVSVQFPNIATLGRKVQVTLVDLSNNTRRSVNSNGSFTFNSGDQMAARRFAVLTETLNANSALVITSLSTTGRSAGALNFAYNLSSSASVKAQILGADGRMWRELTPGRAATQGINSMQWDGRDSKGVALPIGLYMLKLTASDSTGHAASAVLPFTLVR